MSLPKQLGTFSSEEYNSRLHALVHIAAQVAAAHKQFQLYRFAEEITEGGKALAESLDINFEQLVMHYLQEKE